MHMELVGKIKINMKHNMTKLNEKGEEVKKVNQKLNNSYQRLV